MIVKENVSVYKCEFCSKKLFVKNAMVNHELNCSSNPINHSACVGCIHIEDIKIPYIGEAYGPYGNIEVPKEANGFRCKKLDKILYPFKVVKKGLLKKYPETFEGQERMPVTCESHEEPALFDPLYF